MRPKLIALLTSAALLGAIDPAVAADTPPATKTPPRTRKIKPRKDLGPVVNAIGYDKLPEGGTRLYVELSRKVPMSPSGSGRELVYTFTGTHLGSFNDSLPIDTRYQNTPILRARMLQKKKDVELHVSLRADSKPTVNFGDLDGGRALLTVDFANGDFVKVEEEAPPPPPTAVPMPGTTGTSASPVRNQPPPTTNPHADDPDYVPRAGTEETIDGRAGKSTTAEAELPPRTGRGSIGLLGGYGFGDTSKGFPNLYAPGVGAQLGYTFGSGIYLGGVFVYHFGQTVTVAPFDVKGNWLFAGGEFGYDFLPGDFVIRPAIEVGYARLGLTATGGGTTDSRNYSYLQFAPALDVLYTFGSGFVGIEGRYWLVTLNQNSDAGAIFTGVSPSGFAFYGTLGATF